MRHISFPMICISIAVATAGCGHVGTMPASAPLAGAVKAQSVAAPVAPQAGVTTGAIQFDGNVNYKTIDILGIGQVEATKLATAGIGKVDELLMAGATRTGRAHLAAQTGISEKLIMTWVNHADLMRVVGCGPEYANLLERAGVDTVPDLATRNAIHLAAALSSANALGVGKVCVHRLPDVVTCTKWVQNATSFKRIVTY